MGKKGKPKPSPSRGATIWVKNASAKNKDTTDNRLIESDKHLKELKKQYLHEKLDTDILKQRTEQFVTIDKYEALKKAYIDRRNRWIWE